MPLDEQQTFLKWAGGKRRLVRRLVDFLPTDMADRRYHEPFLGAGSMFLEVRPSRARLSDLNIDLISTFDFVRAAPKLIHRYLQEHRKRDSEKYYYEVRKQYNSAASYSAAQAARFIYLNRTCFNGIFRVSREGLFNVPYGRQAAPLIPTMTHLQNVSEALADAQLNAECYEAALQHAQAGDFVYLDPPYPPLNGTSFFRHYTSERFDATDQLKLHSKFADLDVRGCLVMMSNADTPLIRSLYQRYQIAEVAATRWISCKNRKHAVSELVITNYEHVNAHRGKEL